MRNLERAATYWLGFVLIVAPLKFGVTASMVTTSFAPCGVLEVLFSPWPTSWAPVFGGIALLLVVLDNSKIHTTELAGSWETWLPGAVLLVVCAVGFIRPVNYYLAVSFTWHLVGATAFGLALVVHIHRHPKARQTLLAGIAIGMMLVTIQVLYQYFIGYQQELNDILYRQKNDPNFAGAPAGVIDRLRQNRPMGGFTLPNSLAAHLILVCPLVLTAIWNWARNVDPPRQSQIVLTAGTAIVFGFCLYTTKSRAAMLSLVLAGVMVFIAVAVCEKELRCRYRMAFIIAIIAIPIAALLLYLKMRDGRSLGSLYARFEYWRGAWEMFKLQPLTGFGLGEFFPNFLRFKLPGAETARLPHSIFYHFIALCGIAGGLACLFFMAAPFLLWRKVARRKLAIANRPLFYLGIVGPIAWIIHSATDLNIHIPCTVMMFTPTLALLIKPTVHDAETTGCCCTGPIKAALSLLAVLAIASIIRTPGDYKLAALERAIMTQQAIPSLLTKQAEDAANYSPGNFLPWVKLGAYAIYRREWSVAERCYREAIHIDPEFADAHLKLGTVLTRMGKFDEAENELRTFFYWNPHHANATTHWRNLQHTKHQK